MNYIVMLEVYTFEMEEISFRKEEDLGMEVFLPFFKIIKFLRIEEERNKKIKKSLALLLHKC